MQATFSKLQKLLRSSSVGDFFVAGSPAFDLLCETLLKHPRAKDKIGSGIVSFTIEQSPLRMSDKHFVVVRKDGSRADFSFYKCLQLKRSSHFDKLNRAFRQTIQEDNDAFKERVFGSQEFLFCPISGHRICREDSYTYHYPKAWSELLVDFMTTHSLNPEKIEITEEVNNAGQFFIADKELVTTFRNFHYAHAQLAIVYWRAGLAWSSKGRRHYTENSTKNAAEE